MEGIVQILIHSYYAGHNIFRDCCGPSLTYGFDNLKIDKTCLSLFLFLVVTYSKNPNLIKALLDTGAYLYFRDAQDKTVLHYAVLNNDIEMVRMLLDAGMFIDVVDDHNKSPLCYAIEENNVDLTKFLLENNANIMILKPFEMEDLNNQDHEMYYVIKNHFDKKNPIYNQLLSNKENMDPNIFNPNFHDCSQKKSIVNI